MAADMLHGPEALPFLWDFFTQCGQPHLVGVMVAGAAMVGYYNYEKERRLTKVSSNKVTTIGEASIGGKWLLVDVDGNLVSDEDYLGKFVLVYFGFTNSTITPFDRSKF